MVAVTESAPEPAPSREPTESVPEPAPYREPTESALEPAPFREPTESAPEPAPSRGPTESAPEPAPSRGPTESVPEPAPSREPTESVPEPAPSHEPTESAPEPAPSREPTESLISTPPPMLKMWSFGAMEGIEEEDDAISVAASAREEWSNQELGYTAPHGSDAGDFHHSDVELLSVLSKAVDVLGLEWAPPAERARSRLDEWYLQSDRGRKDTPRRPGTFFPEVHEKIKKLWNLDKNEKQCVSPL